MFEPVARRRGDDFHAANGIDRDLMRGRGDIVIPTEVMPGFGMPVTRSRAVIRHPYRSRAFAVTKQVTGPIAHGIYPTWVWYQGPSPVNDATRRAVVTRLRRIEGQVGGLIRMVDNDRYCVDVLTQINAVRAALHKVEEQILRDHISHCVSDAFSTGDVVDQRQKVEELIGTIGRMTR
jgi:DNA-binding FrmR family transcriptional regulator